MTTTIMINTTSAVIIKYFGKFRPVNISVMLMLWLVSMAVLVDGV